VQAKSVLRYLSAYVNKGAAAVYFFAAKAAGLALVSPSFFAAVDAGRQPGPAAAGPTMAALGRFTRAFTGPAQLTSSRRLSLLSVRDYGSNQQFAGERTPGHPPLYDHDVLAFFPFQVTDRRFVIPVYVMTRDVVSQYNRVGAGAGRTGLDLRPEPYDLVVGGLNTCHLGASASDPLSGRPVSVQLRGCRAGTVTVRMSATDSPRVMTLSEL
jgi:hypothetical protein